MRNAIKYYYNIEVEEIKQYNNYYLFDNYMFLEYYKQIDLNIYYFCINNGIYVHEIIYNINNEYVTVIDKKPYILLKMKYNIIINLDVVINYNIPITSDSNINWARMWADKIDYYEKFFNNVNSNIGIVLPYYIGMGEIAIRLYNTLKLNEPVCICHSRLNNNIDFFNPLNLVIDYKVRDIGEYVKEMFFDNKLYRFDLENYIINSYLNYNECVLLLCRLLFPSYFFDLCDDYIQKQDIDNKLDFFCSKVDEYEFLLSNIYFFIKQKYQIPRIDWLISKNKTQLGYVNDF